MVAKRFRCAGGWCYFLARALLLLWRCTVAVAIAIAIAIPVAIAIAIAIAVAGRWQRFAVLPWWFVA
jgi:ABC-type phosphate transport system permease subunit